MKKKIIYLDMDETLFDFSGATHDPKRHNPPEMYEPGFFENLRPIEGACEAVQRLYQSGLYRLEILTQPLTMSPASYTGKANAIAKWFPYLINNINMTQDKTLLMGDYLIDDSVKWKDGFVGEFIHFDRSKGDKNMWLEVLGFLL